LNYARGNAGICTFEKASIYVFGGFTYNKDKQFEGVRSIEMLRGLNAFGIRDEIST
jgi:hypothetical protein